MPTISGRGLRPRLRYWALQLLASSAAFAGCAVELGQDSDVSESEEGEIATTAQALNAAIPFTPISWPFYVVGTQRGTYSFSELPYPQPSDQPGLNNSDGVRFGDTDGDGWEEVLVSTEDSGHLFLYRNPGPFKSMASNFSPDVPGFAGYGWEQHLVATDCGGGEEAILTDINRDGRPDIICASSSKGEIYGYIHGASDRWNDYPSHGTAVGGTASSGYQRLASADLDGDECPEIISGALGGAVDIFWCVGNERSLESYTRKRVMQSSDYDDVQRIIATDWNADHKVDLLVSTRGEPSKGLHLVRNYGNRTFMAVDLVPEIADGPNEFVLADIDGDGALDGIVPFNDDGGDFVALLEGVKGGFTGQYVELAKPWADPNCSSKSHTVFKGVAVGNLDQSPWPEIAVTGRGGIKCTGGGYFFRRAESASAWTASSWGFVAYDTITEVEEVKFDPPSLRDLDWDGALDIVQSDENGDWGAYGGDKGNDHGFGLLLFRQPSAPCSGGVPRLASVRDPRSGAIYYVTRSCTKRWISNWSTYEFMGAPPYQDDTAVVNLSSGTNITQPDMIGNGMAVHDATTDVIYYIQNGRKRPFPNWASYVYWLKTHYTGGYTTYTSSTLAAILDGPSMPSDPSAPLPNIGARYQGADGSGVVYSHDWTWQ